MIKKLFAAVLAVSLLAGCNTPTKVSGVHAYSSKNVTCMGVDGDGTQVLRAWGTGANKTEAIDNGMKNAVRAVIFDGINDGTSECSKKPLIFEVNAQEKYEMYFNAFFANNGEYRQYVRLDSRRTSRIKADGKAREAWGVVVYVNRPELRQKLINDNIIKP